MALSKGTPTPVVEAPTVEKAADAVVAEIKAATAALAPKAAAKKPDYTGEDKKVRGQVRMHAIIAGYRVGGMLAATLGTSPASVREELHKLAAEVADKIEGYSFDA